MALILLDLWLEYFLGSHIAFWLLYLACALCGCFGKHPSLVLSAHAAPFAVKLFQKAIFFCLITFSMAASCSAHSNYSLKFIWKSLTTILMRRKISGKLINVDLILGKLASAISGSELDNLAILKLVFPTKPFWTRWCHFKREKTKIKNWPNITGKSSISSMLNFGRVENFFLPFWQLKDGSGLISTCWTRWRRWKGYCGMFSTFAGLAVSCSGRSCAGQCSNCVLFARLIHLFLWICSIFGARAHGMAEFHASTWHF